MTVKVVDASVAAAILFVEPDADRALALLAGANLIAPALLPFELANVAVRKVKTDVTNADLIRIGLSRFEHLGITLRDVNYDAVADLAIARSLSGYDAAYLWLSLTVGAQLLTFDKKLLKAATGA